MPVREYKTVTESTELLTRRAVLGPAYRLFYDEPLLPVHGEDVWLEDADGRRYLDAYNNVPVVGHGNARVVQAMAAQAAALCTHTRYLRPQTGLCRCFIGTFPTGFKSADAHLHRQ